VTFYHFFSLHPRGAYTVYLNTAITSWMRGRAAVARAFEEEAGCLFGEVTADGLIGLFPTSCIGMNDQEPSAIINGVVFTRLTPARAKHLVRSMKTGKPVRGMVTECGDGANQSDLVRSMVSNNIRKKGPVIFGPFEPGSAVKKAVAQKPEDIISEIKKAKLLGRGGAGFPTGLKWEFCRREKSDMRYVLCNADEGEPGTFKDRVILTEMPQLLFEGMAVAGYAIGAREGLLYLRSEYAYLRSHLEAVLERMRRENLLSKNIAGSDDFSFDITIASGAGAYVCGEESALLESAEGRRGEPRNRPPFPVQTGYRSRPTAVNNAGHFRDRRQFHGFFHRGILRLVHALPGREYRAEGKRGCSGLRLARHRDFHRRRPETAQAVHLHQGQGGGRDPADEPRIEARGGPGHRRGTLRPHA